MATYKRHTAEFKAKGAGEAIRTEGTMAELSKRSAVQPTVINGWKRQPPANRALSFDAKPAAEPPMSAGEVAKLRVKIGQRVVERNFPADASGLILGAGGKRR